MADDHPFYATTVCTGAHRLRIRHALDELRREKTWRGLIYPGHVARGELKPDVAEKRNTALDDAIEILDALTRHDDALLTMIDHVRALRRPS